MAVVTRDRCCKLCGSPLRSGAARVLLALRQKRGWTQGELAERSGICQSMLSRTERGQHALTLDDLTRLGKAFGMTAARLANKIVHETAGRPR